MSGCQLKPARPNRPALAFVNVGSNLANVPPCLVHHITPAALRPPSPAATYPVLLVPLFPLPCETCGASSWSEGRCHWPTDHVARDPFPCPGAAVPSVPTDTTYTYHTYIFQPIYRQTVRYIAASSICLIPPLVAVEGWKPIAVSRGETGVTAGGKRERLIRRRSRRRRRRRRRRGAGGVQWSQIISHNKTTFSA
ncbi:hypothetical protein LX36DRAFT_654516 [Colletotrichum falcatum]|nr:hypothetical protein LX36DRAFT_654516 [Colletotrichum falcatum]